MIGTDIKHIGNQVSMTTDLKKAIDFFNRKIEKLSLTIVSKIYGVKEIF
jgi:prefoldin subunit 5